MTRQRTESTLEVGSPSVEVAMESTIRLTIVDDRGRPHTFRLSPALAGSIAWQLVEATSLKEEPRG